MPEGSAGGGAAEGGGGPKAAGGRPVGEVRSEAVAGRRAPPGVGRPVHGQGEGPAARRARPLRPGHHRGRSSTRASCAMWAWWSETAPSSSPPRTPALDTGSTSTGAPANATLGQASSGMAVCVTVTLVDGLVLARSAFHHSINYRSVVVYGTGTEVTDVEEKRAALAAVVEHIVPGRGADRVLRPPPSSVPPGSCVSPWTRRPPRSGPVGRRTIPRTSTCRCGPARYPASDGAVRARRRRGPAGVVPDPPIPDRLRPTAGHDFRWSRRSGRLTRLRRLRR